MMTLSEFCFLIDKKKTSRMSKLTLKEIFDVEFSDENQ